jgi:hypothetical protein
MNHFSSELFADLARGVLLQEDANDMLRHVANCSKCRQIYEMWRALVEITRKEKDFRPNVESVRRAKAHYGMLKVYNPGRKTRASLVFDSFRQHALAGVRNSVVTNRRLHYEAGALSIDIELQKEASEPNRFHVIGQVLNTARPDQQAVDFHVLLWRGRRFVTSTTSSPLGEFQFELTEGKSWKLVFEVGGDEVIPIALPDLTEESSTSGH